MRFRTILIASALLALTGTVQAQVAVSAQTVEKKQFTSPMSLDVNFNLAHKSLWGQGRVAPKQSLNAFICDGMYVDDFGMEGKGKGSGDKEMLEATIFFTLNAENGAQKRKVSVSAQLFDGETAITEPVKTDTVKLKDNDKEKMKLKISVPYAKLRTEPLTTLKLTVTAVK